MVMKLRFQIVLSILFAVVLGNIEYALKAKRTHLPGNEPASRNGYYSPIYRDAPEGRYETREINAYTAETRLGGAVASYTHYGKPQIEVHSDAIQLEGSNRNGAHLTPIFTVRGDRVKAPETVTLRIYSYSTTRSYSDSGTLSIYTGGRQLFSAPLVPAGYAAHSGVHTRRVEISEALVIYPLFAQAAESKSIRIRVGEMEALLTAEEISRLRNMKRMVDSELSFSPTQF
jgi:hypothetical protein